MKFLQLQPLYLSLVLFLTRVTFRRLWIYFIACGLDWNLIFLFWNLAAFFLHKLLVSFSNVLRLKRSKGKQILEKLFKFSRKEIIRSIYQHIQIFFFRGDLGTLSIHKKILMIHWNGNYFWSARLNPFYSFIFHLIVWLWLCGIFFLF